VGIDGWKTYSAIVHLSGEDFITEEVVSEDTTVTVRVENRVSSGYIY